MTAATSGGLQVHPATPERWDDLAQLAGPQGFHTGCWCLWWRTPNAELGQHVPGQAEAALRRLVDEGTQPGLLAYLDNEPVGWVALGPREVYRRLARTQKLQPVDDAPVWSVTCLFVAKAHRGSNVSETLLEAATHHATGAGATQLEAYPIDTAITGRLAAGRLSSGPLSLFLSVGFVEVTRRSGRPIVRRHLS